jgi:hypothetical protein
MAAEDQGHVTWLRDTLLAHGGAAPDPRVPPGGGAHELGCAAQGGGRGAARL